MFIIGKIWLGNNAINQFFDKYSSSVFFVFALHTIVAMILCRMIEIIGDKISITNDILWIIIYFLNIAVNIAICIACYNILNRHCPKALSILTGGR